MPEFVLDPDPAGYAKIKVIGVGGGGCNAVDWMFNTGLQNVEFHVLNTDAQALGRYKVPNRMQIGPATTQGRGAGGNPEIGARCVEEQRAQIEDMLKGADIAFITAGLGGGTGTGGAPVVANIARQLGILTVGVVTRPFKFEGTRRYQAATSGLERLRKECDTIIVISNDKLIDVVGQKSTMVEAFVVANGVLSQAVQAISDLVTIPGLINVDFNDVRAVMGDRGGAVMGIGVGKGENRAEEAVRKATSSPLLEKLVINGATGVLVNITGGSDLTIGQVNEAMTKIHEMVDTNAQIIIGAVVDESVKDEMRVTIIATGFPDEGRGPNDALQAMQTRPAAATSRFVSAAELASSAGLTGAYGAGYTNGGAVDPAPSRPIPSHAEFAIPSGSTTASAMVRAQAAPVAERTAQPHVGETALRIPLFDELDLKPTAPVAPAAPVASAPAEPATEIPASAPAAPAPAPRSSAAPTRTPGSEAGVQRVAPANAPAAPVAPVNASAPAAAPVAAAPAPAPAAPAARPAKATDSLLGAISSLKSGAAPSAPPAPGNFAAPPAYPSAPAGLVQRRAAAPAAPAAEKSSIVAESPRFVDDDRRDRRENNVSLYTPSASDTTPAGVASSGEELDVPAFMRTKRRTSLFD